MLSTPDITNAQIAAAAQWIVAQIVALGWLDANSGARYLQIVSTVLAVGLVLADAVIRHGRSTGPAPVVAASAAPVVDGKDVEPV